MQYNIKIIKNFLFLPFFLFYNQIETKIITISDIVNNSLDQSFLIHPNIAFQKKYDQVWESIFEENKDLTADALGIMLKNAIHSKEFYQNHSFFIGFSSSGYQFEGSIGNNCSWHQFALNNNLTLPGDACGFWTNFKTMIEEMKSANINTFRMSIEWSRIEPIQGQFDYEAMSHYRTIIQTLKDNNIEPLIVLNHYTVPTWFEKIGDFEFSENIIFYVKFAEFVYLNTYDLVTFISTCNAPEGIAFKGRYTLTGAPGKEKSLQKTIIVMKNILESHVMIYEAIKGIKEKNSTGWWQRLQSAFDEQGVSIKIPEPMIGIQKNIIQFDIAAQEIKHYLLAPVTAFMNQKAQSLTDDPFYTFLTKGVFSVKSRIPSVNIEHFNFCAPCTLDWIGVNYYSNKRRFLLADIEDADPEKRTMNPNYRFYSQGLYRAVKEIDAKIVTPLENLLKKTVPIWITENGIASINESQRQKFNKEIMIVLNTLIAEDLPIIGYTQWASHDNWEWGSPLGEKRYGSFFVDFENIYDKHPLKAGAQELALFMKTITT